jgi:hypothetical protein
MRLHAAVGATDATWGAAIERADDVTDAVSQTPRRRSRKWRVAKIPARTSM